jgi:hypothetical protein
MVSASNLPLTDVAIELGVPDWASPTRRPRLGVPRLILLYAGCVVVMRDAWPRYGLVMASYGAA